MYRVAELPVSGNVMPYSEALGPVYVTQHNVDFDLDDRKVPNLELDHRSRLGCRPGRFWPNPAGKIAAYCELWRGLV